MGYPKGRVVLKKAGDGYDVVFSTCGMRAPIGASEITVTELPSERIVCKLSGDITVNWWRYGEPVPGQSLLPATCSPLQVGKRYEIRAHGWTIVEIDPSGTPRAVDASCKDVLDS
jgi:hypothetical protein